MVYLVMNIPVKALRVMELLNQAGARDVLVVGGFVRDSLLGIDSKDVDIEVYGVQLEDIKSLLESHGYKVVQNEVAQRFYVLKVDGLDISIPREEISTGPGPNDFVVMPRPDMNMIEAANRRDFTINSMAMTMHGLILDPFNGREDLRLQILSATSDAFTEDPVRVLRGMQFASRFNMTTMDERTTDMCREMAPRKANIAKERIWEEWKKWALRGRFPSIGLEFLIKVGWADPEIQALVGVPQDPEWHPEGDVFVHTCHVVDAAAVIAEREQLGEHDRLVLMFSALAHDFGKPSTTKMEKGRWRSKRHCEEGVKPAERFLERIMAPKAIIAEVKPLISEHLIHAGIQDPTDRAIRRLANRIAPASIQALSRVIEADHSGRPPLAKGNPFASWVERAARLDVYSAKPEPILMGRHLIEMDVRPGKQMGVLLSRAFEAQLDGVFDNLEGAQQWVSVQEMGR